MAVVDRLIRPLVMVPGERYLGRDQDGLLRRQLDGTEVLRDRVLQPAEVVGAVALGAVHHDQAKPHTGLRLLREWRGVLRVVVRHALARGRAEREQGLLHSARGVAGAGPTAEGVAANGIAADGSVQLGVAPARMVRVVHGRLVDVIKEAALRPVRPVRDRLQALMLQLRSHLAADRLSDRLPALGPTRLALVRLAELFGLPMQGLELPDRRRLFEGLPEHISDRRLVEGFLRALRALRHKHTLCALLVAGQTHGAQNHGEHGGGQHENPELGRWIPKRIPGSVPADVFTYLLGTHPGVILRLAGRMRTGGGPVWRGGATRTATRTGVSALARSRSRAALTASAVAASASAHAMAKPKKVHTSALCWVPAIERQPPIQTLRLAHDRQIDRWPPHVNVLYPFVPEAEFEAAAGRLAAALQPLPAFGVTLGRLDRFVHGRRYYTRAQCLHASYVSRHSMRLHTPSACTCERLPMHHDTFHRLHTRETAPIRHTETPVSHISVPRPSQARPHGMAGARVYPYP
eukprot:scaffold47523_cov56-Phaeocystis_antarctica.AAC.2